MKSKITSLIITIVAIGFGLYHIALMTRVVVDLAVR